MTERFKNQYRIPSARLQSWDYGWNGIYFITICTQHKKHYFGSIVADQMQLSPIGVLADVLWIESKNHANNINLGEFVVMPNHVHIIVFLHNNENTDRDKVCLVLKQVPAIKPSNFLSSFKLTNCNNGVL